MASVFVLLEAFNRKEAAALGFFPCATASLLFMLTWRGFEQGDGAAAFHRGDNARQTGLQGRRPL